MVSPGQSKLYVDQLLDRKLEKCGEKRRSHYPAAFVKYRFYLDIRSARVKAALIEDILALGGVSNAHLCTFLFVFFAVFRIRKIWPVRSRIR
jgi:hypothetical protein